MMGRIDVRLSGFCKLCGGTGRDPKKRKRTCPKCFGSKMTLVCESCGEDMPCSGTRDDIFDQTYCMRGEKL